MSTNLSRTVVENNLFEQCNGDVEIVSNKSGENVYRHNTFVECVGALTLRHGKGCVVEGNYFLGHLAPQTGGVRIIGEDHTREADAEKKAGHLRKAEMEMEVGIEIFKLNLLSLSGFGRCALQSRRCVLTSGREGAGAPVRRESVGHDRFSRSAVVVVVRHRTASS